MSKPVGTIQAIRGETINFGLGTIATLPLGEEDIAANYVDTPYDGTETVTSKVKAATNKDTVPDTSEDSLFDVTTAFVAASGDVGAYWLFTISAAQSLTLTPDNYIIDAKVVYGSGAVDYPSPILLKICEHVTS